MPFNRGYRRRFARASRRRQNRFRRRRVMRRAMIPRRLGMFGRVFNVHRYKRHNADSFPGIFLNSSTGQTPGSFGWRFSHIAGSNELKQLYDSYRIDRVVVTFRWSPEVPIKMEGETPISAVTYPLNHTFTGGPVIMYKRDYDDINSPTEDELRQSNQTRIKRLTPNGIVRVSLKPAVRGDIQTQGSIFSSNASTPSWRTRLDMTNDDVLHHGLKWLIRYPAVNQPGASWGQIETDMVFYFTCYNTR